MKGPLSSHINLRLLQIFHFILCRFRKIISTLPPQKGLEITGEWGVLKGPKMYINV